MNDYAMGMNVFEAIQLGDGNENLEQFRNIVDFIKRTKLEHIPLECQTIMSF